MKLDFKIGGFTPMTTIDYPGHLSAVLYCQGCPCDCAYCHNPDLRFAKGKTLYQWTVIKSLLQKRVGFLEAVVFSGGEPLVQRQLFSAMQQVKSMGFLVGIHTTGLYPDRLRQVLPLVDWVGLDIKAPFSDYEMITKVPGSGERAKRSARIILASGIFYDFRTTTHSKLLSERKLMQLADELHILGVKKYTVQKFREQGCQDSALTVQNNIPLSSSVLSHLSVKFSELRIT